MDKGVPIRSISRCISVLQAVNRHGSLSMMAISRQGGVPYPTACRIVQTLIHEGLIEQEPARKHYRPTALVQSLAHGYRSDSHLVEIGREPIRALTKAIGWPVSITVRVGTQMVVRDSTHSETALTFERYYPGFALPLVDSASGRICLAQMSADELDSMLHWLAVADEDDDEDVDHSPGRKPRSLPLFEIEGTLGKIRAEGYAAQGWGQHNLTPGKTSSIAVPIFRNGQFEAALTMIYFASAMKQSKAVADYLDPLRATAGEITTLLSDRPS